MEIKMRVLFSVKLSESATFDELLRFYAVPQNQFPRRPSPRIANEMEYLNYDVELANNSVLFEEIRNKLEAMGVQKVIRTYTFSFEDDDFENSPLYYLLGTGNSPDAFLEDQGADFELEVICDHCKLHRKQLQSPLVIDTSVLSERLMIKVDHQFLVISEKMAELLAEWKMTGYELQPVIHSGDEEDRQTAYQLIPTNILPSLSGDTPSLEIIGMRKCPVCNLRGTVKYPLHYNAHDLQDAIQDFNLTQEHFVNGNTLMRLPLVSARFWRKVIEHGITEDIRGDQNTEEMDWRFEPVIRVDPPILSTPE